MILYAEDYGGSLALPHFGSRRLSADYFNSNLILHNFVNSDLSTGQNSMYLYDERTQGKGCDAVCSLRMKIHLEKLADYKAKGGTPKTLLLLLDNCTGQNKSNHVMQFMALLSMLYEKVIVIFFIVGHTHMVCDRVVHYLRSSIKGHNL